MKKLTALFLCLIMALGVTPALAYTSGTYTGVGRGLNGDITVEVIFSDDEITSVTVLEHGETAGVSDAAIEQMPQRIVEHQSLAVDTVTGASYTSNGILEAVAAAVTLAGGDVEALKAVEVVQQAGDPIDMTADIVVVGGGGAGLAAAVTAAEEGASVILVEKSAAYGGNTILSGGYFQAAEESYLQYASLSEGQKEEIERYCNLEPKDDYMAKWQEIVKEQYAEHLAAGHEYLFDSPELHMIQTYDGGDYLGDPELIEMMCYGDVESMHWLSGHGFSWKPSTVAIVGSIWMRCKASADYASGQGFIAVLSNAIEEKNLDVTTVFDCTAEHLIQDNETGRVIIVTGTGKDGTPYTFKADKAIILATGGFSANVEMRQQYDELWGNLTESVPTTNAATITGDGINMALEVGAALVDMGQIQLLPTADPVTGQTNNVIGEGTNMYVNQEGKRFVDESSRRDVLAKAILAQPGSYCYVISTFHNSRMDEEYKNNYHMYLDDLLASGAVVQGDTLEELAEKIGVPVDTFVETCTNFNQYAADSNDPEFGRVVFPDNAALEMEGPFYACKRAPAVHHTMGGIKVNVNNQVLDEQGQIVPGLYAAGEVTGGFHGSNRLGGNAVAEVITTGRNAAAHAVAE
ncbi:MAG: flavocytochrome c [Clostridia bacterium]|nr:flavocytochrome c [Clostridia bacterium]